MKAKYGEELQGKFVKLSKSVARSDTDTGDIYLIREDGSLFGAGKNTTYQLFGEMSTNLRTAKEMKISYMEITDRVNYIKEGNTKNLKTNIIENFNMYAKKPVTGQVTWSSSNAEIASVDKNGNITAIKEGQTTITAREDKYGYIASAIIYVVKNTKSAITVPQIEQGLNFTVVLKADGTVWTAGTNSLGECGNGSNTTTISELTQVKINENTHLTNVVKISSGLSHTIALTKDGKVYGWGLNTSGQLGINSVVNTRYAQEMLDIKGLEAVTDIIDIKAGRLHSVVLDKNGYVYSTGYNAHGELGDNTTANKTILVKTKEVQNIIQISSGQYHTLMQRGDMTVWGVRKKLLWRTWNKYNSNIIYSISARRKDCKTSYKL